MFGYTSHRMLRINCIILSSCSLDMLPLVRKCVSSLTKSAAHAKISIKVILVADSLKAKNPLIQGVDEFLNTKEKIGFGVMNNIAIDFSLKKYSCDYLLLMNDDAWLKKDFFKQIKNLIKNQNSDLICPLIYKLDKKNIDSWGIEYFRSGYATPSRSLNIKNTLVTGTCMIIKKEWILKLKKKSGFVFNPLFYFYHEDVELSIRLLSLNASIVKTDKAIVYHKGN